MACATSPLTSFGNGCKAADPQLNELTPQLPVLAGVVEIDFHRQAHAVVPKFCLSTLLTRHENTACLPKRTMGRYP